MNGATLSNRRLKYAATINDDALGRIHLPTMSLSTLISAMSIRRAVSTTSPSTALRLRCPERGGWSDMGT